MTIQTAQHLNVTAAARLPRRTHFFFGVGGIVNGMVLNGLSYFLLIYYNLVLGLAPSLTGLALAIALVFDAISDPLVGFVSDNWKSKLGRRHPFLYASLLPVPILFVAIWLPPEGLSQIELFAYLATVTILLRLALTLFDIPGNALVPEITKNYDERTNLMTYKVSSSWISGLLLSIAMYMVFLVPTDTQPNGLLNQEGYVSAAYIGAGLIFLAIFTSSVGLHGYIHQLRRPDHPTSKSPFAFFHQLAKVVSVPSLRALILSGVFAAVSSGLSAALWVYVYGYYWEFSTEQVGTILFANLIGAVLASFLFPAYADNKEKKSVTIQLSCLLVLISALPFVLREFDLMPLNGSDALFLVMFVHGILQVGLVVAISSAAYSMSTDIVEQSRLTSGQQTEAIILSTQTFTAKSATAGGTAMAGMILSLVGFPTNDPNLPTPEVIQALGLSYMASVSGLSLLSIFAIFFYRISRDTHLKAIELLAEPTDRP